MARKLIVLALAACGGERPPPVQTVDETKPEPPTFRVDVKAPPSCARATPCEARIELTALADFKVNKEYPFKFVADASPQLAFDGPGTFTHTDVKTGTHTITFRADATGTVKVSGTFKLSVCTDDVCKIEQPKIAFDVPISL